MANKSEDVPGEDEKVTGQVNEIAEVIYLELLPTPIARKRRADIYNILLKAHREYSKKFNDLNRRLYIAEKALADSVL